MLKTSFVILAATLPILGQSEECCEPVYCLVPSEPIESCQLPAGYYQPATLALGNSFVNISLAGEFIYWQSNFYAVDQIGTKVLTLPNGDEHITNLFHNQRWKPGFKVALGLAFPCLDNWAVDVEYTRLHSSETNHFTADPLAGAVIISKPLPQLFPIASSALRSHQKVDFDLCYLVLGRPLYSSKRILVNPGIGLQAWWLSRTTDLNFTVLGGLPPGIQHSKHSVWTIGAIALMDVQVHLLLGAYFGGRIGIATAYIKTHEYKTDTAFPITVPPALFPGANNVESNHKNPHEVAGMLEGNIRLGWGSYLFCDNYHVDLVVGYDFIRTRVRAKPIEMGMTINDWYAQGISVRAQFDF